MMTNSTRPALGIRLRYILLLLWLVWLSVFVVWEVAQLASLKEASLTGEGDKARIEALQAQLNNLVEQQESMRHQLSVRPTSPDTAEVITQVEQRLAALEMKANAVTYQASTVWHERLEQMESQIRQLQQALAEHKKVPSPGIATTTPRVPDIPPFRLLGIELRAGTQLLSVLPRNTALEDARLLSVGDEFEGWRLKSLDAHSATFEVRGRSRTLRLPEVADYEK